MKILHVITSLQTGGAEKLVAEIVPMLSDYGHHVDVVAFDDSEPNFSKQLTDKGIKVIFFGKGYYKLSFIFRLGKLMKGYDIVHTHNTACQFFAAFCSFFCKCVLVTTEHNTTNRRRKYKFMSYFDRWMYNRYNYVICISQKTEDNLKAYIRGTKARIFTINNGINLSVFQSAQPILKKTDRFVITMVGAFRPQKDQDTIVRAIQHLDKEKIELWLVGDGERRDEVEALANHLGVDDNVKFWGIRSDVPSILKASDLIVMSSHWEGFGLAAVEGMAAGKPVIASKVDGLAQVVGCAGLVFEPGNEKELAREIERLAQDADYYKTVALKCSKRAFDFDIRKMINGYADVYEEISKTKTIWKA